MNEGVVNFACNLYELQKYLSLHIFFICVIFLLNLSYNFLYTDKYNMRESRKQYERGGLQLTVDT